MTEDRKPAIDAAAVMEEIRGRIERRKAAGEYSEEELREWARAPRSARAVRWLRESEVRVPGFAIATSPWIIVLIQL